MSLVLPGHSQRTNLHSVPTHPKDSTGMRQPPGFNDSNQLFHRQLALMSHGRVDSFCWCTFNSRLLDTSQYCGTCLPVSFRCVDACVFADAKPANTVDVHCFNPACKPLSHPFHSEPGMRNNAAISMFDISAQLTTPPKKKDSKDLICRVYVLLRGLPRYRYHKLGHLFQKAPPSPQALG